MCEFKDTFREGRQAYKNGMPACSNPYLKLTDIKNGLLARAWLNGWEYQQIKEILKPVCVEEKQWVDIYNAPLNLLDGLQEKPNA